MWLLSQLDRALVTASISWGSSDVVEARGHSTILQTADSRQQARTTVQEGLQESDDKLQRSIEIRHDRAGVYR